MNQPTVTTITLSGRVATNRHEATAGDIYLYRNDDRSGAQARHGRHTNYGYSGYYLASVFDGNKWRKLQFNELVAYENRSYHYAAESGRVFQHLCYVVANWRGRYLSYNSARRAFL